MVSLGWLCMIAAYFDALVSSRRLSATNCAKVYDLSFSQRETHGLEEAGWPWGFKLKTEHVWDAFVILSLLRDREGRLLSLEVPHTGLQKDRFKPAMRERNLRFVREGQPEVDHWCRKCTRIFRECNTDGTETASEFSHPTSGHAL